MLVSLWMLIQFVLLTLSLAFGSYLPESPVQALLFVIAGALIVVPLLLTVASALTRALALAPNAPPRLRFTRTVRAYRVASDPGLPGSALARAPSRVVHASA